MMRSLGVILGIDISGMLFLAVSGAHSAAHGSGVGEDRQALALSSKPAFMDGLHVVMMTLVGVALLCAVFSYFRKNDAEKESPTVHIEPMGA